MYFIAKFNYNIGEYMKLYNNLKKYPLIISLCVFFSWWIILFTIGFLSQNISNSYSQHMMRFYLTTIIVVYLMYLFIIPSLFKIKFKNYFANRVLTITKEENREMKINKIRNTVFFEEV